MAPTPHTGPSPRTYPWSGHLGSSDDLLDLRPAGPGRWTGCSPAYPWGWVYGGHIVAQALRAALLSCDEAFCPSTLHCTFLRPAHCALKLEYRVEQLTYTQRCATRSVVVSQGAEVIAHVTVTLDTPLVGGADCVADFEYPPTDALAAARAGCYKGERLQVGLFERRLLDTTPGGTAALITLDRAPTSLSEATCLIAYAADDLPTDAARAMLGNESYLMGSDTGLWSMTATYAIHFGTFTAGRELLFDTCPIGVLASRASIKGCVVDVVSGRVVALCMQQVMIRVRNKSSARSHPSTTHHPP